MMGHKNWPYHTFCEVTDRQTESDAYEPTVQYAQVGSIIKKKKN